MSLPGEVNPDEAWAALTSEKKTLLIDVRTRAEWSFVGVPDTSSSGARTALIEWQSFPSMARNEAFVAEATEAIESTSAEEIYFLCRSGARSMQAAMAIADASGGRVACFNVAEGFEGDLDGGGHRGVANGWKARGLPWRQT